MIFWRLVHARAISKLGLIDVVLTSVLPAVAVCAIELYLHREDKKFMWVETVIPVVVAAVSLLVLYLFKLFGAGEQLHKESQAALREALSVKDRFDGHLLLTYDDIGRPAEPGQYRVHNSPAMLDLFDELFRQWRNVNFEGRIDCKRVNVVLDAVGKWMPLRII